MFDSYIGRYVMVSVPEARIEAAHHSPAEYSYQVKPRFTEVDEASLKIAKNYLHLAADEVRNDSSPEAVRRAMQRLETAQSQEPWHDYPRAGLEKNPVYVNLKRSYNVVQSYSRAWKSHQILLNVVNLLSKLVSIFLQMRKP